MLHVITNISVKGWTSTPMVCTWLGQQEPPAHDAPHRWQGSNPVTQASVAEDR